MNELSKKGKADFCVNWMFVHHHLRFDVVIGMQIFQESKIPEKLAISKWSALKSRLEEGVAR